MAQKTSASLSPKEQNVSFIAWLCSRFNMPASPLSGIAADFIKNLGVDVPFQKVDVQTKIYGIDVLLTLKNIDDKDYYVVIEVVTDERLKSKEGTNYPYANYLVKHPLGTGIDTLIQTMHVSEDRVFTTRLDMLLTRLAMSYLTRLAKDIFTIAGFYLKKRKFSSIRFILGQGNLLRASGFAILMKSINSLMRARLYILIFHPAPICQNTFQISTLFIMHIIDYYLMQRL